jgi:uncharacterized membrane protein
MNGKDAITAIANVLPDLVTTLSAHRDVLYALMFIAVVLIVAVAGPKWIRAWNGRHIAKTVRFEAKTRRKELTSKQAEPERAKPPQRPKRRRRRPRSRPTKTKQQARTELRNATSASPSRTLYAEHIAEADTKNATMTYVKATGHDVAAGLSALMGLSRDRCFRRC